MVAMPKTPVNKNYGLAPGKNQVGGAGEVADVKAKSEA
jgi:hypothetical protein